MCLHDSENLCTFGKQPDAHTKLDDRDEEGLQNAVQDLDVSSLVECAQKLIDALVKFEAT